MYFIQFSMLQMKERAKFMPENKVFGQAGGEIEVLPSFFINFVAFCHINDILNVCCYVQL